MEAVQNISRKGYSLGIIRYQSEYDDFHLLYSDFPARPAVAKCAVRNLKILTLVL